MTKSVWIRKRDKYRKGNEREIENRSQPMFLLHGRYTRTHAHTHALHLTYTHVRTHEISDSNDLRVKENNGVRDERTYGWTDWAFKRRRRREGEKGLISTFYLPFSSSFAQSISLLHFHPADHFETMRKTFNQRRREVFNRELGGR